MRVSTKIWKQIQTDALLQISVKIIRAQEIKRIKIIETD